MEKDSEIFLKEDEKDVMEFNPVLSENKSADRKIEVKKLNDMWWSSLPYVLVCKLKPVHLYFFASLHDNGCHRIL